MLPATTLFKFLISVMVDKNYVLCLLALLVISF